MTNAEAIEHLKNIMIFSFQDGYTDEAREALDMAIKALEESRWIPCKERLPEVDEDVFVYLWDNVPYLASMNDKGQWETEHFYLDADDAPKAWKPLPEPYREDTNVNGKY